MLNFRVAPEVLTPYVPRGTVLNFSHGEAWMSLVGFRFLSSRVMGVPLLGHQDFPEVNLRFYVRPATDDRRGVVFIREIVPRPVIGFAAHTLFNEPYVTRRMDFEPRGVASSNPGRVAYGWWHRNRWNRIGVSTLGEPSPLVEGTHEEFIAMQQWGFTRQRDGFTIEYAVAHRRWSVWRVTDVTFDVDVEPEYGRVLAAAIHKEPDSAFLVDGSTVEVGFPKKLVGS